MISVSNCIGQYANGFFLAFFCHFFVIFLSSFRRYLRCSPPSVAARGSAYSPRSI